jgi:hypothetical protein
VDQSRSSEDNSYATSQEILRLVQILTVHYHIHKRLQTDPILSQMNRVHILLPDVFKINFNIIPFYIKISQWSVTLKFPDENLLRHVFHACYMPHPRHSLDLVTLIMFGAECTL